MKTIRWNRFRLTRVLSFMACAVGLSISAQGWGGGIEARLNVGLSHELLMADDANTAFMKVGLLPIERKAGAYRTPLRMAIVLDRSGSMNGEKLETAKKAVIKAIHSLYPNDEVSLVAYDDKVEVIIPMTRKSDIGSFEHRVNKVSSRGSTAIYAGLNEGVNELRKALDTNSLHRVLLLSDGLANVGPQSPADFARLGQALQKERITISTIGLGSDYNEDLMVALSGAGEGNSYFAESHYDLGRIFESEIGNAAKIVASEALVEVRCADGVRPIRVMGREGEIDGNVVRFKMNNLIHGEEKYALIEVEIAGGKAGAKQNVATALARYRDFYGLGGEVSNDSLEVGFTNNTERQEASVNLGVQREVVRIQIADAQNAAIALADKGEVKKAAERLQTLNEEIVSYNKHWNDSDVAEQSVVLADKLSEIEEEGMTKENRKWLRSESYRAYNQTKN